MCASSVGNNKTRLLPRDRVKPAAFYDLFGISSFALTTKSISRKAHRVPLGASPAVSCNVCNVLSTDPLCWYSVRNTSTGVAPVVCTIHCTLNQRVCVLQTSTCARTIAPRFAPLPAPCSACVWHMADSAHGIGHPNAPCCL